MKSLFLLVALCIILQACASPRSPYITQCDQPECEKQAKEQPLPQRPKESQRLKNGSKIIINADFSFVTDRAIEMLAHQDDLLILSFADDTKIGSATLSLQDYGLEKGTKLTPKTLFDMAFLETFSNVSSSDLSPADKHTIRAIKLEAMNSNNASVYTHGDFTIYFYSASETEHKAYVVEAPTSGSWVMLDFFGLTEAESESVLRTLTSF